MKKNALFAGLASAVFMMVGMPQAEAYFWSSPYGNDDCCYEYDCCEENYFFVDAEYLYWTTSHNRPNAVNTGTFSTVTGTALTPTGVPVTTTTTTFGDNVSRTDEKYNSGFRVGLGWMKGEDNWDIELFYTYLHNSHSRNIPAALPLTTAVGATLPALPFVPFTGGFNHKFNYNVGDLEFGYTLRPHCEVSFRPFIGLRGIWIHHDHYSTLTAPVTVAGVGFVDSLSTSATHHADGVGPRAGFCSKWGNWGGISVKGDFSASILYTRVESKYNDSIFTAAAAIPPAVGVAATSLESNVKDTHWRTIPNLQLFIGLNYEMACNCEQSMFNIWAGWEANYYWDTHTDLLFHRNLGLQGLTTGLSFDF